MPFSFLAPAFLAGFALLAVPIILHMVNRPKDRVIEFPSLMFLDAEPYPSATRRRIRNPLLLLLRCLALVAVAAAFARPALERPIAAVAGAVGGREVVILVDRSYSMAYGDRTDRALAAARDAVGGLANGDRATLAFFDDVAAAVTQSTDDRARLLSALDAFEVESSATRYAPALELAASILATSDRSRREVVLISDFQRAGWSDAASVLLPAGTTLTPVTVADGPVANAFVASVGFNRGRFAGRDRVGVTARIVHRGTEPVEGLPVTLELDGRPIETLSVDLPANGASTVAFEPLTIAAPNTRGTVRIESDALARDDAFRFVLSPDAGISVLILERSGSGPGPSLYLRRALAIGEAPAFRVETGKVERIGPEIFEGRDLVILNDAPFPSGAAGRRLRSWIEDGGGLLVVLGGTGGSSDIPDDLLPGSVGDVVRRGSGRGGALGSLDYDHPVFSLFRAPGSGDFTAARFLRYHRFSATSNENVIARFDDGAVALAERTIGDGRVLIWTSTLDVTWNDLALQPVFLPFVHRLIRHAADYTEPRAWSTVGDLLDLRVQEAGSPDPDAESAVTAADPRQADRETASGSAVLFTPAGDRIPLAENRGLIRLTEQGFYEVRDPGAPTARPRAIAANLDIAESDLTPIDPAEIVAAVAPPPPDGESGAATTGVVPGAASDAEERDRRQVVWWFLLAAAVALLAGETLLSNRLVRTSES